MGFIFNDPKFIIGTNDIPSPIQMLKSFVIGGAVNEPTWQDVVISGVGALTLVNAKADSLVYLKLFGENRMNGIPVQYTQTKYTANTSSTDNISTNITWDADDTELDIEVYVPTASDSFYLLQSRRSSGQPIYGITGSASGGTIQGLINGSGATSDITRTAGHTYHINMKAKDGTVTLYVKDLTTGDEATNTGTYTWATYGFVIRLWGNNVSGQSLSANHRVRYVKIYRSGNLVLDWISIKGSDGKAGFWEGVTRQAQRMSTNLTAGSDFAPTTDYPVDYWCNNGKISLFYGNKFTKTGQSASYLIDPSTGVLESNQYYNTTDYIFLKAGKYTVTYRDTTASSGRVFRGYLYSVTDKSPVTLAFSRSVSTANTVLSYSFTISKDYYIRVSYRISMTNTTMSVTDTIIYVDNPTTETAEDSLGNTATAVNLLGVSSTQRDEQEVLTGEVKNKIGVYLCTGTENWTLISTSYSDGTRRIWCDLNTGNSSVGLSNMFTIAPLAQRDDNNMNNRFFLSGTTLHLRSDKFTSLADAKTWLATQYSSGNPVTIYYVLPTATTQSVTAQTMNVAEGENTITITQSAIDGLALEAKYIAGVRVTVTEVENANLDNQVTVTIT